MSCSFKQVSVTKCVPVSAPLLQYFVTPLRFFGVNPSRRASFSTSGDGSVEASAAELAGFDPVAVGAASAAAGAAAEDGAVAEEELDEDELETAALSAGALEVGAFGAGAFGAGD
jgi:hypothetical protein